jgi:hypothetical protein
MMNQFGPNTYNNIIDDIMITTIDKKKTAINNFVGNNFDRNQLMMQTSRVVMNQSMELNTIPERTKAEGSTEEQISG